MFADCFTISIGRTNACFDGVPLFPGRVGQIGNLCCYPFLVGMYVQLGKATLAAMNNCGGLSSDFIGQNWEYPEANYIHPPGVKSSKG